MGSGSLLHGGLSLLILEAGMLGRLSSLLWSAGQLGRSQAISQDRCDQPVSRGLLVAGGGRGDGPALQICNRCGLGARGWLRWTHRPAFGVLSVRVALGKS